jgi:hypothetical protein
MLQIARTQSSMPCAMQTKGNGIAGIHSGFTPAALMIGHHFAISAL